MRGQIHCTTFRKSGAVDLVPQPVFVLDIRRE